MSWADRIQDVLRDGSRAPAGDAWELSFRSTTRGVSRFAVSRVHQNAEATEIWIQARVAVGQRVGCAVTSDMRPEGVRAVLRRAFQIAKNAPEDPLFNGFTPPRPGPEKNIRDRLFSDATAETNAADRAHMINVVLRRLAGDSLEAAGIVSTEQCQAAVMNSSGLIDVYRATIGSIRTFALERSGSNGYAGLVHRDISQLDPAAIASTAARKAVRGRDPIRIPPGDYDVVLEPSAVSEVLEWMSMGSFGAQSFQDGSSCLAGRVGEKITHPSITVRSISSSTHAGAPAELFDVEGGIRKAIPLIEEGVAKGPVYDRRTACKGSTEDETIESTGHAAISDFGNGPSVRHLEMLPGKDNFASLVSKVERGLWITRFHYVNGLLDTRKARMTGMTRDGTFLIENGRITRGVANLRFTDSFLDVFERIEGITTDRRIVPTWWSEGGAHVVPGMLIRGLHFSG